MADDALAYSKRVLTYLILFQIIVIFCFWKVRSDMAKMNANIMQLADRHGMHLNH